MATAILPSSTIFGTDFWVRTEIPMRMMLSQGCQLPHQTLARTVKPGFPTATLLQARVGPPVACDNEFPPLRAVGAPSDETKLSLAIHGGLMVQRAKPF